MLHKIEKCKAIFCNSHLIFNEVEVQFFIYFLITFDLIFEKIAVGQNIKVLLACSVI